MIVIDASVWVSYLVPTDVHHGDSVVWLRRWRDERLGFVAPVLLLAEVAGAVTRRFGDPQVGHRAKRIILELPDMRLIDIDQARGETSADLASNLRLRGADATYVAIAQDFNLPVVTWDDEILTRAASVIPVFTPISAPRSR